MNKTLLLSATLTLALGASAAVSPRHSAVTKGIKAKCAIMKNEAQTTAKPFREARKANENAIYRPTTEHHYLFNPDRNKWELSDVVTLTYNTVGQETSATMVSVDGDTLFYTYEYDENGMLTVQTSYSVEDGVKTPTQKRVKVYDPIVTDFITENIYYEWADGEWVFQGMGNKFPVTRDALGNVTATGIEAPYQGTWDLIHKSTITYDATTNRAVTYLYQEMNSNMAWETTWDARNIVWENTNNQIVEDFESLVLGDNRIKTCDLYIDGALEGIRKCEYTANKPDVTEVVTTPEGSETFYTYKVITTANTFTEWLDQDNEISSYTKTYNTQGDMIREEETVEYEEDGQMVSVTSGMSYDYTYSDDNGQPIEMIVSMYLGTPEDNEPMEKIEWSNFVDAAGISVVGVDRAVPSRIYNLQGICVGTDLTTLPSGLYIINGAKVLK